MAITLRAARINQNISRAEAAKLIGVSKDTIGNWERGENAPSTKWVKKIIEVYKVDYNDIIFLPHDNA